MIQLLGVSAAVQDPSADPPLRPVLREIRASFAPGESHLILGANGSGKTTLIRLLAGLLPSTSGRYLFDGVPVGREAGGIFPSFESLWPRLAVLFEEPDPQFLTDSVRAEVSFGLESLALPSSEIRLRATEAIESLGVRELADRAPQSLSAGEKARTLLAAMLAGRPRALALDQSLAHLDPAARRELEGRLVQDALSGARVLVRTHQEADSPYPGERLHVLAEGSLTEASTWAAGAVLAAREVPFPLAMRVSALLASRGLWSGPLARDAASLADGFRASGRTIAGHAAELRPMMGAEAAVTPPSTTQGARSLGSAVVELDGVAWAPRGDRRSPAPVLSGIDLEVMEGEIVAIVGRSGSGKTTILKLAAGLLDPTSGTIRRHAAGARRAVGLALEFPERQLFGRTVSEDVTAILWVEGAAAEERRRRADTALSAVGLDPRFAERVPSTLSEGEKRRAALAGILAEPPRAILLDEPTAGLDPEGRRSIAAALRHLAAQGHAVLFASHDLDFVSGVADRVIVLGREAEGTGRVLGSAPPVALWRNAPLLARASLLVPDAIPIEALLREHGLIHEGGDAVSWQADSVLSTVTRALESGMRPAPSEVTAAPEDSSAPA